MTIGERIQYFRKQVLKMTQEDFSKRLNVSRGNIASIERGRISVTDRVISDICTSFSLSEEWLRTGEGEMYEETGKTLFSIFAKQYGLSESEQRAARYLLQLSSEERQQILRHITGLAEAIASPDHAPSDIDAELEAYKQELLAAEKGRSASATGAEKEDA